MENQPAATLRLKMSVGSVKRCSDHNGEITSEDISLNAVYSAVPGSANSQWCKWTPSGSLVFTVSNPAAFGRVLPGQFYYVDLVPTDKDGI